MPAKAILRTERRANRFLHAAKISEYQFKRVLWHFTLDDSAAEAALDIRLSTNSIAALFDRLRRFFTDFGVFVDIYRGRDPKEGIDGNDELMEYEYRLLGFHLKRAKSKRRMKPTEIGDIDPHWCESGWRFDYAVMTEGRSAEVIHRMMYAHLLAHIRLAGPVGKPRGDRNANARLKLEQFDQRVRWLERNSHHANGEGDWVECKRCLEPTFRRAA